MTLGSLKIRIKPIGWELKTDSLGHPIHIAILPIGFKAQIKERESEWVWWLYSMGDLIEVMGTAKNLEGAKKGCQKEWENFLKEAFEEDYS